MELLLRHTLDKLELLDMKIVAEPGTLDDRDGFIVDLGQLQEQDVTEEMFETEGPGAKMPTLETFEDADNEGNHHTFDKDGVMAFENPIDDMVNSSDTADDPSQRMF